MAELFAIFFYVCIGGPLAGAVVGAILGAVLEWRAMRGSDAAVVCAAGAALYGAMVGAVLGPIAVGIIVFAML